MLERVLITWALCVMWSVSILADTVKTKDGRSLEGKVIEENDEQIVLEMEKSIGKVKITILKKNILSVEKTLSPKEQYEQRRAGVKDDDMAGQLALASWCVEKGLKTEAGRHLIQIVTKGAESPEQADARRLLGKLGYRQFPKEGWMQEDDFWSPKGWVRWKGGWATKEFMLADRAYDILKEELDHTEKRVNAQESAVNAQHADANALSQEYERMRSLEASLYEESKQLFDKAMNALGRTGATGVAAADIQTVSVDNFGNIVVTNGRIVAAAAVVNTGAWMEFDGYRKQLKASERARTENQAKMKGISAQVEDINAKAKKPTARLDASTRDAAQLNDDLRTAEQRRVEAASAMKAILGPNGLPRDDSGSERKPESSDGEAER